MSMGNQSLIRAAVRTDRRFGLLTRQTGQFQGQLLSGPGGCNSRHWTFLQSRVHPANTYESGDELEETDLGGWCLQFSAALLRPMDRAAVAHFGCDLNFFLFSKPCVAVS